MSNLLIAEIGSVHDGSFGNACKLIDAAARSGAHAVKFQTHIAEAETLASAPAPGYFKTEDRMSYFRRTGFPAEQWQKLSDHAKTQNVIFLSSPFSIEAVELLEGIGMAMYKIPSGEVTNIPMLERIVKTKKPVLLSSGMSNWKELDQAVAVLKKGGPLTVMQCSSRYPCQPHEVGLNVIAEMKLRYSCAVGFSDHTLGYAAPIAAATLGATVIEKHFTFSKLMYGSDAQHSMEPSEFKVLAQALDETWKMMAAPVDKTSAVSYQEMKQIFEKSIVTAQALKAGSSITVESIAFKKPGDGISAANYQSLLGKKLKRDLPKDHKLSEGDFS